MFTSPDSVCFSVCGFPIYYYGVILAFAIFVGVMFSYRVSLREYCMLNIVPNISTSVILGGIVGARLYYCLLNFSYYVHSPVEVLAIREGGLSIHGAILGGVLVLVYQSRKYNVELLKLLDIFALGVPLAQAIGRWGNFFNSEAFGLPTNLPWKLYVKQAYRPDKYFDCEYFHPTFLYESILDLMIFIVLYKVVFPRNKGNYGIVSTSYLMMYSVVRFFVEFLRVDCTSYMWGLAMPQVVSVVIFVVACGFVGYRARK